MGSRAPVSCKSEVHPARPGPAPTPPPSPKCLHLHQSGGADPVVREEVGGGGRNRVPELARVRMTPRGCGAAHDAPQLPPRSPSAPRSRRCAGPKSDGLRPSRASSARSRADGSPACGARVVLASLLRRHSPPPDSVRPRHAPRPAALQAAPLTPTIARQPARHPGPRGPHLGRGSPALRVRPWVGPAPREERQTEINKTTPLGSFLAPLIKRRTLMTRSARAWRGTP